MFEHENFDVYRFEDVPLDRDCYLMDVKYIEEYESSMLDSFHGSNSEPVGYISCVAVRRIDGNVMEISWYPNFYDRFHEVTILLPKEKFITCVGSWQYDEKPHIIVDTEWLESIYLKNYSVFGLVDAIDVKIALKNGSITREKLVKLRTEIDLLASEYPDISFISIADSIIFKSNWSIGHVDSNVEYTYKPELFLDVINKIKEIYRKTLGLDIYAILTQGANEYYDDRLLHISETKNHVCLNSLGIPFAELFSIDEAVRKSLYEKTHDAAEIYMDEKYFRSLKLSSKYDISSIKHNNYKSKMMSKNSTYYLESCNNLLENLKQRNYEVTVENI